ncbi:unnamed protein product [Ilex paraguariensis]|uniref:BED-type domain-containing protein n=1 Tax=Ilex paraguariensis TaxID=185542 RepID=A0ABC8UCD9_9AQUA
MASDFVPPTTVNGGNQEVIDNDAATIDATIEGPSENEPLQKKYRRKTSKFWDDLETVYENGTRKAKCNHCKTSLSLGRGAPTTHLKRHLETCPIHQASISCQKKGPTQQLLALSSIASDGSVTVSGGLAAYKFDKEKVVEENEFMNEDSLEENSF